MPGTMIIARYTEMNKILSIHSISISLVGEK